MMRIHRVQRLGLRCLGNVSQIISRATTVLVVLAFASPGIARPDLPSETPRYDFWVTNEKPIALAASDDGSIIYLAGAHDSAGPITGSFAAVSADSGSPFESFLQRRMVGHARTMAPDGEGGWWVAGDGLWLDGAEEPSSGVSLLHFRSDGSLAIETMPVVAGSVHAMELVDGTLLLAGEFEEVAGEERNSLAAIDAVTGALLPWAPSVRGAIAPHDTGIVYDIDVDGSVVYLGGRFHQVNGVGQFAAAALDITTGELLPWNPGMSSGYSILATVKAIDDEVFIGGAFSITGSPAQGLAATDAATGAVTWAPAIDNGVSAVEVSGDRLYVGGLFTMVNGQPRASAAAFSLATRQLLSWAPQAKGTEGRSTVVQAIRPAGSKVYIGGHFTTVGGEPRAHIAAVDAVTGVPTDWASNATRSSSEEVSAIAIDGNGRVIVAGDFLILGATGGYGALTAFDTETGKPVPGFKPQVLRVTSSQGHMQPGVIQEMICTGDKLYIGGSFTHINGVVQPGLALLNANTGEMIESFRPKMQVIVGGQCVLAPTGAGIMHHGSRLYVGINGCVNNQPRKGFAVLDDLTGEVITTWDGDVSGSAVGTFGMSSDQERLYVIGGHNRAGSLSVPESEWDQTNGASAFDIESGSLDRSWRADPVVGGSGLGGGASGVLDDGEHVWLSGAFTHFEPFPGVNYSIPHLARLRQSDGWPIPSFRIYFDGGPGGESVRKVIRRGDTLLFGGNFQFLKPIWVGSTPPPPPYDYRVGIAAIDLNDTTQILEWNPRLSQPAANEIVFTDRSMFISGGFEEVGDRYRHGFAVFDFEECVGDINGDGDVDFTDLNILLAAFGTSGSVPGDIDGDGQVTFSDLTILLSAWGSCS